MKMWFVVPIFYK